MPANRYDFAEASDVAEEVLDAALKYADRVLLTNADYPYVDTLITQHVKIQLFSLQNAWSNENETNKTLTALEAMGNGLEGLGAACNKACGKYSLHVKVVPP